jgi:hypothetical protein
VRVLHSAAPAARAAPASADGARRGAVRVASLLAHDAAGAATAPARRPGYATALREGARCALRLAREGALFSGGVRFDRRCLPFACSFVPLGGATSAKRDAEARPTPGH